VHCFGGDRSPPCITNPSAIAQATLECDDLRLVVDHRLELVAGLSGGAGVELMKAVGDRVFVGGAIDGGRWAI
jgi:hypothetical protein